jgi:hypothetical protein
MSTVLNFVHQSNILDNDEISRKLKGIISTSNNSLMLGKLKNTIRQGISQKRPLIQKYRFFFAKACARYYFEGIRDGTFRIEEKMSSIMQETYNALLLNKMVVVIGPGFPSIFMMGAFTRGHLYLVDNNPFIYEVLVEYKALKHSRDTLFFEDATKGNSQWVSQLKDKIDLVLAAGVLHEVGRTKTTETIETVDQEEKTVAWNSPFAIHARVNILRNVSTVLTVGGRFIINEDQEYLSLIRALKDTEIKMVPGLSTMEEANHGKESLRLWVTKENGTRNHSLEKLKDQAMVAQNALNGIKIEQYEHTQSVIGRIAQKMADVVDAEAGKKLNMQSVTAMTIKNMINSAAIATAPGGIDLKTAKMNLQVQNEGAQIKFNIDPAMLQRLQNAPGFVPVIINIQPMTDLRVFLGLPSKSSSL